MSSNVYSVSEYKSPYVRLLGIVVIAVLVAIVMTGCGGGSSKPLGEWADQLKNTTREEVVDMLGKPDQAREGQNVAGDAVRFVEYTYYDSVESSHTGNVTDLKIVFDWDNTRKVKAADSGKSIELMY